MPGLRSLRNRLAVVFGLIVLGAIATIYLSTTPRLEERLTNQRLEGLAQSAKDAARGLQLPQNPNDDKAHKELEQDVSQRATRSNARSPPSSRPPPSATTPRSS